MRTVRGAFFSLIAGLALWASLLSGSVPAFGGTLEDALGQLPLPAPPRAGFGLAGDDAWLEAGQRRVPVAPRRRTVEISGPGRLEQADTEYRLVNDVVADGTAFFIANHNITLNLDGHTVVYGRNPAGDENYGVHIGLWNFRDVRVLNGRIIQAEPFAPGATGRRWETPYGTGSCPIWGRAVSGGEFAGLFIRYGGDDTSGINLWGHGHHIHHNTIEDVGAVVSDRHKGLAAIEGSAYPGRNIHHNLILRARHNGIRSGRESFVHDNIVHVDSWATNSAGISSGGRMHRNKVEGVGQHPIGFYLVASDGSDTVEASGNHVRVQCTRPSREYGSAGAAGIRYQSGGNVTVRDNTVLLEADSDYEGRGFNSWGRAVWASVTKADGRALFENNLIAAVARNGRGKAAGIAVTANNISSRLVFRNNTVVSNWGNVLLADSYGHAGGFALFDGNTFVKASPAPEHRTVRGQYSPAQSTAFFRASQFAGGASYDDMDLEFSGRGLKEVAVGWRVDVSVLSAEGAAVPGARVSARDARGVEVFSSEADADGRVGLYLAQYVFSNRGMGAAKRAGWAAAGAWRQPATPHAVTASAGGRSVTEQVSVHRDMSLVLRLPRDEQGVP